MPLLERAGALTWTTKRLRTSIRSAVRPGRLYAWLDVVDSQAYSALEDSQLPGPAQQRAARHAVPRRKFPALAGGGGGGADAGVPIAPLM